MQKVEETIEKAMIKIAADEKYLKQLKLYKNSPVFILLRTKTSRDI